MIHKLRFRADLVLDLQVRGKPRLEQVQIRRGDLVECQVQPFVQEAAEGPVEKANLHLGDEGVLLGVPMACFCFE